MRRFSSDFVFPLVVACIALDAVAQSWVEWKRLLWGQLALSISEKATLTFRRLFGKRIS